MSGLTKGTFEAIADVVRETEMPETVRPRLAVALAEALRPRASRPDLFDEDRFLLRCQMPPRLPEGRGRPLRRRG